MTDRANHSRPADTVAARLFGGRNRHGLRTKGAFRSRPLAIALGVFVALVGVALGAATLLAVRLSEGPLAVDMFRAPLAQALEDRIGHGYRFEIGETALDKGENGPALTLRDVAIRDSAGRVVIAAPQAKVELNLVSLLLGSVRPTRFELVDLDVRFAILTDGTVAISAGSDRAQPIPITLPDAVTSAVNPAEPPPAASAAAVVSATPVRSLEAALAATIDAATNPDSALGALVRLGIAHGRLVIDDQAVGQTTTFDGFELAFDKGADGSANLAIAANGPNGRWTGKARATSGSGDERSLDIELHDLSLAEIMLAGELRYVPFETDFPLSVKMHFSIGPDGALRGADGSFGLGAGHFRFDDPDDVSRLVDEVVGTFRFDPASRTVKLDPVQFYEQNTQVSLTGTITPPATNDGSWDLALRGGGTFAPAAAGELPLIVAAADIGISYKPSAHQVLFERVAVKGPNIDATLTGSAGLAPTGPSLKLHIATGAATPVRSFLPIWPVFVAPNLRKWMVAHFKAGSAQQAVLAMDLVAKGLADSRANRPIPVEGLDLNLSLKDASIDVLDGALPLAGLTGNGHITGRTATFANMSGQVDVAPGKRLSLSEIAFAITDTAQKPAPATVTTRLQGGADALAELLMRPALKPYASLPPDLASLKGQVDGRVALDFKIGPNVTDAPAARATGQITNYAVDKVFGDERIEGNQLTLNLDRSTIHAKGDARIFGAVGTIELNKAVAGPGEATLTATFDDAARQKRGIGSPGVTGPIVAKMTMPIGQADAPKAQVELDLTRAAISNIIPGLAKSAGKPGRATFALNQRPDGLSLDQLAIDSGTFSARGSVELGTDGKFLGAKLQQVRMSPNDDMHVEAVRTAEGTKLTVRGNSFDARPFLHDLFSATTGASDASKDIDVDLKSQSVTGQNQQTMTGVDLKMVRRGAQLRQLQLTGRLARSQITAVLSGSDGGTLSVMSADAGATLSFLDLYKHMQGGQLAAKIRLQGSRQDGTVTIHDFVVRNEPAMQRLTSEAVPPSTRNDRASGSVAAVQVDPASVPFTTLQTTFTRTPGMIALTDTVAWGHEIGATVEGTVDFAHDRVNLHGTFVPAYTVNNFFSQIPLFGPILGGGSHEGLFAVTYRIAGPASSPQLLINPLSAIAPGFLRQIFGAFDAAGNPDGSAFPQAPSPPAGQ